MPELPSGCTCCGVTSSKKFSPFGPGPIVIGQGCEFDYSGVQACKALREEGYKVVLVNSNPATIMTDPEFADRTYVEPITPEVIEAIMEREKPDAILPTLGGQTALNAAMELNRNGALARHGVKLIGANAQAIAKGEAMLRPCCAGSLRHFSRHSRFKDVRIRAKCLSGNPPRVAWPGWCCRPPRTQQRPPPSESKDQKTRT